MPLMFNNRTLALLAEGTYGVLESLSASNVHRFTDPEMKYVSATIERLKSDGTLGTDVGAVGSKHVTLTMKNLLRGDGSSGDPSWAASLLPSVGMPAATANTYTTSSTQTSWKSISAASNINGKRRTMRGGMGDLTITGTAGMSLECAWNFVGGYSANRTDTAQLTGITYEEVVAPIWANANGLTIDGSTAYKAKTFALKLNTNPFPRHDPNATGGYIGGWLTNIKPTLTIDPEAVTVATKDWDNLQATADQMDISMVANGGAGNTITITCTNCQQTKLSDDTERDGMLVDALEFSINGTVTIAFS